MKSNKDIKNLHVYETSDENLFLIENRLWIHSDYLSGSQNNYCFCYEMSVSYHNVLCSLNNVQL